MKNLNHLNSDGHAQMVDVGEKRVTRRRAVADGVVRMLPDTVALLKDGKTPKGDALAAARIAGIMAAKKTPELIPLCHQIRLSSVSVKLDFVEDGTGVYISAEAKAEEQTGVEMEALTAVTVAALTLYDMLKAIDKTMSLGPFRLVNKEGGQSEQRTKRVRVVVKTDPAEGAIDDTTPAAESENKTEVQRTPSVRGTLNLRGPRIAPSEETIATSRWVKKLSSKADDLVDFLGDDPIGAAYMLGDLEKPYAEHCDWYGLHQDQLKALLLAYRGLSVPAILTKGEPADVEAVVVACHERLPGRFYFAIPEAHQRAFDRYFSLTEITPMTRMGLKKDDYTPGEGTEEVVALTHRDTASIMRLYEHYPDHFFEPHHLGTGYYFGIRDNGDLISVAGIHTISTQHDVAAIGNIVTHVEHRGHGLAAKCVRRLLDELFKSVGHVCLNVGVANTAAIACYRKIGFTDHRSFIEGWATAR